MKFYLIHIRVKKNVFKNTFHNRRLYVAGWELNMDRDTRGDLSKLDKMSK